MKLNEPLGWKKSIFQVAGGVLGAPAGLFVSFYAQMFFGELFIGPDFSQVAWIFAPPIALFGLVGGAFTGFWLIDKHPKVFLITVFPVAAWMMSLMTLRFYHRPHQYSLEVVGTQKAPFRGYIEVDGQRQALQNSIPASFNFRARRIKYAIALVDQNGKQEIGVQISGDGKRLREDKVTMKQTGEYGTLMSFGYSEYFGGTNRGWLLLDEKEAQELLATGKFQSKVFRDPPGF